MRTVVPDLILPISEDTDRDACIAVGPSWDEILWLTGPRKLAERPASLPTDELQLHSYRAGPHVTKRSWRGRQRPDFVQPAADGLLFVSARVDNDDTPNAWSSSRSSKHGRRLSLGDGISDARVSPSGKIWAAYIDEGVFGAGRGAAGLVKFDGAGRPTWRYDALEAGTEDIAEVYAFNLAGEDDAWLYFYPQFAIVRWMRSAPTVWRTRVEGARAIAVRPGRALLLGDYDDPCLLRVLDLPRGGGSARVKTKARLLLPEGTDPAAMQAYGVADRLALWSAKHLMILQTW